MSNNCCSDEPHNLFHSRHILLDPINVTLNMRQVIGDHEIDLLIRAFNALVDQLDVPLDLEDAFPIFLCFLRHYPYPIVHQVPRLEHSLSDPMVHLDTKKQFRLSF